jgi:hypothetical protein
MTTVAANKLRVVFDTNVYFSAFTHPLATFWRKNEYLTRSLSIRAVPHFCNSV